METCVSDTSDLQNCSDRSISSCASCSMRKLVLWKDHYQLLITEPAKTRKLSSEIYDVIDNLFNQIALEILPKSYGKSVTSRYWRILWAGFEGREFHSIESTEKYKVALRNLYYWFETSANTSRHLKVYSKTLFSCKSRTGNTGSSQQHILTTDAFLKNSLLLMS